MNKQNTSLVIIAIMLIIAAAISRLMLYPHNFSPITGMAIFGGAVIQDKRLAFAMPILAMFISDVMFEIFNIAPGFWGWGQLVGYGILALITLFAFNMKKITLFTVTGYSIGASLLFFLLSNSSFFVFDNSVYHTYSRSFSGYINCLVGGIPFLKNALISDLFFCGVLFGGYLLMGKQVFKKAIVE